METIGDRITREISISSPSEPTACSCCGVPYRALLLGAHRLNCLLEMRVPLEVKGPDRWKQIANERKHSFPNAGP